MKAGARIAMILGWMLPALVASAGIGGRVTDRDGAPIARATVTAIAESGGLVTGETGADGRFRFDDLPGDEVTLRAMAPGFRTFVTGPVRDGDDDVAIPLERPSLWGRVEQPDGSPARDAWVVASPRPAPEGFAPRSWSVEADSRSGEFGLDLEPGAYSVRVASKTLADSVPIDVEIAEGASLAGIVVRLRRPAAIVGRVVLAADGRPVVGALVTCDPVSFDEKAATELDRDSPEWRRRGRERSTHAAEDGSFSVYSLDPGSYRLAVSGPTIVSARSDVIRVFEGESVGEIAIAVTRPGSIRGRAFDDKGRALAGLYVSVSTFHRILDTRQIREDGSFEVPALPPGEYDVFLAEPTSPTARTYVDRRTAFVRDGDSAIVIFGSPPGDPTRPCRMWGVVSDAAGPLALASVILHPENGFRDITGIGGADGRFEFESVRPGEYRLEVVPSGTRVRFTEAETIAVPDALEWRRDVRAPSGAIAGRVLDAETRVPVPDAVVTASLANDRGPGRARLEASSDAEGRFRIEPLRAGRYRVTAASAAKRVTDEGTRRRTAAEADVDESATRTLDLHLAPSAVLVVHVRDAAGVPLPAAAAWIETEPEADILPWPHGIDRKPGRHEFTSLVAGAGTLFVFSPLHAPVRMKRDFAAGTRVEETIVLVSGGALRVRLEDESGNPVADAIVALRDAEGALVPRRAPRPRNPAVFEFAAGPRVEFPHLEPGRYTIAAEKDGVGRAEAVVLVADARATETRLVLRPPR